VSDSLKSDICNYNKENPNKTQIQIAEHFNAQDPNWNLERSTISKILKEKNKWLVVVKDNTTSDTFHYKKVKFPLLDQAMKLWVEQVVGNRLFLTEALIKKKATYFAKALS
ncbi:28577_t:CDS:1, partial [Gigaspora margarita]